MVVLFCKLWEAGGFCGEPVQPVPEVQSPVPECPGRSSLSRSLHSGSLHPKSPQLSWRKKPAPLGPTNLRSWIPRPEDMTESFHQHLLRTHFVPTSLGKWDEWATVFHLNFFLGCLTILDPYPSITSQVSRVWPGSPSRHCHHNRHHHWESHKPNI